MHVGTGGKVALQNAQACIRGVREGKVRVLFDTGSHKSFVTTRVVESVGLAIARREWLSISTFGNGRKESGLREVVEFDVMPLHGREGIRVEAYVVPEISSVRNEHPERAKAEYAHLKGLWLSDVCKYSEELEIEVLIGADFLWQFQTGKIVRGRPCEPVAVETCLGWVLSGPMRCDSVSQDGGIAQVNLITQTSAIPETIDGCIKKLWDLETLGIREVSDVQEDFLDSIAFNGTRYSVKLPWKAGREELPSNRANSMARLGSTLRKLKKEPEILEEYDSVIREQVQAGIIEAVPELDGSSKRVHYLPHHAVVRRSAETTKVRVVYDASAKEGKGSRSLNDCLHVGPSLNPLLYDILLRFRMNKVALIADIEKAFLNVEVDEEDRDSLRFLWPEDPRDANSQIMVYRFCRVVFGLNASPFLLNGTLRHHLQQYKEVDQAFVNKMIESFYVDDRITGENSIESSHTLYIKARERLAEGGFRLRKWRTNDKHLQELLDASEPRITEEVSVETYAKSSIGVPDANTSRNELGGLEEETGVSEPPSHKVLGQPWNPEEDTLHFRFQHIYERARELQVTKRNVLGILARLFDPLGIVSPVMISGKIILQELCALKVDWDRELTGEIKKKWERWIQELENTGELVINRWVYDGDRGQVIDCQLHGFSDASKKAYCAAVYLVYNTEVGTKATLLTSKTRVAPLKELTIPRLELMGARVLAQLMKSVKAALKSHIQVRSATLWTDSLTVLYWIQNNGEWKQFVKHRVGEILQLSNVTDWKHCPGVDNPADLGSRGVWASELKRSELWWDGPRWLSGPAEGWPATKITKTPQSEEEEKGTVIMAVQVKEQRDISVAIEIERFSALLYLIKVTAWVRRFIHNARARSKGQQYLPGRLTREELYAAEKEWIKSAQMKLKTQENFDQLVSKLGLVEEAELLRCKGRLCNSDLGVEALKPVILPRHHKLTDLIVLECHRKVHHCGVRGTLAEVRSRFWVPKGRQVVKGLVSKCVDCKKQEGKAYKAPQVADLPEFRVQQAEPFSKVGIDFAGPLYFKKDAGIMEKAYVALFSCCVTRALHLDLVRDLTAATFRRCLRRFAARRGSPSLIVSDNGKTFKATAAAVEGLYNHPEVRAYLEANRMNWRFNLERAPWWGGFFERMVGSVKRCLKKTLGTARLSYDELLTALVEVESTLNNRPLTYSYEEPEEEPLTPSHLIHGRRINTMPDEVVEPADDRQVDHNARFRYLSVKLVHFWNRWQREYLADLREYHNNRSGSGGRVVEIGDVVIVSEEESRRNKWKMGVVERLVRGRDDVVRGAVVRVAKGGKTVRLSRIVQKLHPIEVKASNEAQQAAMPQPHNQRPHAAARERRAAAIAARDRIAIGAMLDP